MSWRPVSFSSGERFHQLGFQLRPRLGDLGEEFSDA
jgi:hypothetical protein